MRGRLLVALTALLTAAVLAAAENHAAAGPGDVYITQLSCDSSPEFVRIKNFGSSIQSLSNAH